MSSPVSYDLQGQGGGQIITSASGAVTGTFRWVQVINDVIFNTFDASNLDNTGSILGITIPAGVGIGGIITVVEVTTGLVIAYYA